MVTFVFVLSQLSRVLLPQIVVRGVATASILDLLTSITSNPPPSYIPKPWGTFVLNLKSPSLLSRFPLIYYGFWHQNIFINEFKSHARTRHVVIIVIISHYRWLYVNNPWCHVLYYFSIITHPCYHWRPPWHHMHFGCHDRDSREG